MVSSHYLSEYVIGKENDLLSLLFINKIVKKPVYYALHALD